MARPRRRPLLAELVAQRPGLADPEGAIAAGRVVVDGAYLTNPRAQVRVGAALVVEDRTGLRGAEKLGWALDTLGVEVAGRVALDVGAAAGGFTTALLDRGARRVFAVDVGHGQLTGGLRQHPAVVNLEATNVADLDRTLVDEEVQVVVVDVSYLALRDAVAQLTPRVVLAPGAVLVGLVKPMFELATATLPTTEADLAEAVVRAQAGVEAAGWTHWRSVPSPVPGRRGAVEFFLLAAWER